VTVTDTYGRYVSGLSKNAFTILDEKQPQEITYFSDDDAPVSVGVIFDVSGSMIGDKIRRAREALSKFIQTSHVSIPKIQSDHATASFLIDLTVPCPDLLACPSISRPRSSKQVTAPPRRLLDW
jgi:hypothetical protein